MGVFDQVAAEKQKLNEENENGCLMRVRSSSNQEQKRPGVSFSPDHLRPKSLSLRTENYEIENKVMVQLCEQSGSGRQKSSSQDSNSSEEDDKTRTLSSSGRWTQHLSSLSSIDEHVASTDISHSKTLEDSGESVFST